MAGPIYYALHASKADIVVLQGGTDSGKTYAAIQEMFTIASTTSPPTADPIISIVSESVPNSKKGAYRVAKAVHDSTPFFQNAVKEWKYGERIIFFKTGWVMEFLGAVDEQNAKNGKRQYLFVNEAQGVAYPIFWQYAKRTRIRTVIDYNPSAPFWAHEKLIGTTRETNDLSANVELMISDHRHNPFLSEREHQRTENIKDKDLWLVYARGKTGNLTGLIYPNWKQIPDADYPWDADNKFGGIDFGYTNDPTAAVRISRIANKMFLHELCYKPAMTPVQINQLFRGVGFDTDEPIYCEHDGDMIRQLRELDLLAIAARKGPNSIKAGILKVKEYDIYYTASSKNIKMEIEKYMWMMDPDTGRATNVPVDKDNHCFVGDTMISTSLGQKPISDIEIGDFVTTEAGEREVLMKWDNGVQQVNKYRLQFDTFSLTLICTPNHRIKTDQGWIDIQKINSTHGIFLLRPMMGKYSAYIQENDITLEDAKDSMSSYGKRSINKKYRKDSMSTTSIKTLGITTQAIFNLSRQISIYQHTLKNDVKIIQNGQNYSMSAELRRQRCGIDHQRVESGTRSMALKYGNQEDLLLSLANGAERNMRPGIVAHQNSVIKIARLKHLGVEGSWKEPVYDLTVEEAHHYIANGIVVHNCADAIRYAIYSHYYRSE